MSKKSARRSLVLISSQLLLILIGIAMALALAEFAARTFLKPPYTEDNGDQWSCDRWIGWRGKRNTSNEINSEGYIHNVIRNSAGMYDREHALDKPTGIFRILVIGDSFVEARQVAQSETSPSFLETTLNSLGDQKTRYEVISAGASGWGPDQELMYFRTEGQLFKPDLVVGYWYPANDLMDVLPDHRMTFEGTNCYAPYFAICQGEFDPQPWFSAPGIAPTQEQCSLLKKFAAAQLYNLYSYSRLYQQLEPLLAKHQSQIKYAAKYSPWLADSPDPVLDYAYTITDKIYGQLAYEANQIGAKTALVIVPLKEAVSYEASPAARQQLEAQYPDLKNSNPRLPNQRLTALMDSRNIPVFDLQPKFVDHLQSGGGVLYGDVDSHWNVPGNQLAGQLIAQWLIEQQLVSVPPKLSGR
jgi:hypothetical protein